MKSITNLWVCWNVNGNLLIMMPIWKKIHYLQYFVLLWLTLTTCRFSFKLIVIKCVYIVYHYTSCFIHTLNDLIFFIVINPFFIVLFLMLFKTLISTLFIKLLRLFGFIVLQNMMTIFAYYSYWIKCLNFISMTWHIILL